MTYSYTQTTTFTITHVRHLVAKVSTDLKRMQRFYGSLATTTLSTMQLRRSHL